LVSIPKPYIHDPSTTLLTEVIPVPNCRNCGAFVTPDFARVFGSNDGEVFGCPECTSFRALITGGSATPAS
jgi:Zn finger protein HypA/HybF involved in hydrogenase expression